jgi:predicted acetyltransferase
MPGDINREPAAEWDFYLSPRRQPKRFVAVREPDAGAPDGFVIYTIERRWRDGVAGHLVEAEDLVWASPEAHATLWRYLLDIDLVSTVRSIDRPLDDPIRLLLRDPPRARMGSLTNGIWVKLLDPAAALAARGYFNDGEVTLEVHGVDGSSTRMMLMVTDGRAACEPTTSEPELELGEQALAAAFLGGHRVNQLHRAGLVTEHRQGAVQRLDSLLQGEREPWCSVGF